MDVRVENHRSIILFCLLTLAARSWWEKNVQTEEWQYNGGAVAVEPRWAEDVATGMLNDGLEVTID